MPQLVQPLPDGPLDIIGDVHGELDALLKLLARLGVDVARGTVQRPLVFVGDLVDRGPDSPGVVEVVRDLVQAGLAFCVAGNHELNLLQEDHKEGNGWFFGHADTFATRTPDGESWHRPFESRALSTSGDRDRVRDFLASLPVALVRPDLRIVHACWDADAIASLPEQGDLAELARAKERELLDALSRSGLLARSAREREQFADLRDPAVQPDRLLEAAQAVDLQRQQGDPLKVLTSGRERAISLEEMFYVGGKWRFVTRDRWWEHYTDAAAVVVGHYWRRRSAPVPGKQDLWDREPPWGWAGPRGNVICVDYSVGRRFLERWQHPSGAPTSFRGGLAALRWPERTLVFDDRSAPIPTTGFGGG